MKLWLLRHAAVEAPAGLCYGRTDLSADESATRSAAASAAPMLPAQLHIVSSPLRRCRALADALARHRPDNADIELDDRLAEMDFGRWEGRPWSAIPRNEFDAWTADFASGRAGETGESSRSFLARVGAAYDDSQARGRDSLWITHAGVIRAVWLLHAGVRTIADAGQWPARAIAFGECVSVEVGPAAPAHRRA